MTVMERIESESYITASASFEFEPDAAPVLLFTYGPGSRSVVPLKAEAEWTLTDGAWVLETVSVWGKVVRASGELMKSRQHRTAYRREAYAPADTAGWAADAPQALKDAVAEHGATLRDTAPDASRRRWADMFEAMIETHGRANGPGLWLAAEFLHPDRPNPDGTAD